ncbi:eukaryotic membrane protein family-domain-containing protein [Endogone sp. FLAS-F59071]|nr:eukaryotic membrane protein family-domain-containing protein [Endogone sp. FLAS-F59071]|eukprot:RUS15833.1 eukaryotic membrane protein family-domain-containing protein [Endogone sp. FLAS-F59071]
MVTLNVAINFYSNELLTLLISNQFVEIKGSVFKKFERENLFQLSCSDIVERFQQFIFLLLITLRNVIELSESPPLPFSILPSTFVPLFKLPTNTTFDSLLTPVFMVIVSELLVDWLKHAFITKSDRAFMTNIRGSVAHGLPANWLSGPAACVCGEFCSMSFVIVLHLSGYS